MNISWGENCYFPTASCLFMESLGWHDLEQCIWIDYDFFEFARKLTKSYFNNGLFCQVSTRYSRLNTQGRKPIVYGCEWNLLIRYPHVCAQYFMPNYEALCVIHMDISWFGSFVMKVSFVFILIYIAFNRLYLYIFILWLGHLRLVART